MRGGADAAQAAGGELRLQDVGGVHGAAAGGAGADDGVYLVDEQHRPRDRRQIGHDRLEASFEVAPEPGTGQQRAHVQGEDAQVGERRRRLSPFDQTRQALGDRGLAHAGVADQERIVLVAPAQDLLHARQLLGAADQRIDLAPAGAKVEVGRVAAERRRLAAGRRGRGRRFLPVGDELQHVQARDALPAEEPGGVRPLFLQQRRQHVAGAGGPPFGRLRVGVHLIDHPVQGVGEVDLVGRLAGDRFQRFAEVAFELAEDRRYVAAAAAHDRGRHLAVQQGEQQVLQGDELMAAALGFAKGGLQGELDVPGEQTHAGSTEQRNGKPRSRAMRCTALTLDSAICSGYSPQTPTPRRWISSMTAVASEGLLKKTRSRTATTKSMVV